MQVHQSSYGPRGLSCLTCRQRRKKCDRTRPTCQRCIKGQFECLGYDNTPPAAPSTRSQHTQAGTFYRLDMTSSSPRPSPRRTPTAVRSVGDQSVNMPIYQSNQPIPSGPLAENTGISCSNDWDTRLRLFGTSGGSILSAGMLELMSHSHSRSKNSPRSPDELQAFDETWPQEHSQSLYTPCGERKCTNARKLLYVYFIRVRSSPSS
ncbi:hypothetical protein B0J17DRAFT_246766 [Rhizoctonia solani]|nr:hypothetical protein B0J17DRAFT_246766 [Rhizoctonia solani]